MSLLRILLSQKSDAVRKAQELGIEAASRVAAQILKEDIHDGPEFLPWQIDTLDALQKRLCRGESIPETYEVSALDVTLNFISHMPEATRRKMAGLLTLFEAGPYALGPTRSRFTALSGPHQDAYLRTWESATIAPQRAIYHALKSVAVMGYWTQPPTWGHIGYSLSGNPGLPDRLREN